LLANQEKITSDGKSAAVVQSLPPIVGVDPLVPVFGSPETTDNVKVDYGLTELVVYPKEDDSKKPIGKDAPKPGKIPLD